MDTLSRIILLFSTLSSKNYFNFTKHPDVDLTITQLVTKYGYPIETHKIKTSDGYHLKTYRIPHGINSTTSNIHPVLLVHGTCGCSENFLALGPKHSLGFFLADMGFDVWLMNNRGNFHSRKHDYLNPDTDKEFWDFSFDEIGAIDLPANIDYILKKTNKSKLGYIGHSQGTTNYYVMTSTRAEYNDKINVGITMVPTAYVWNEPLTELLADHLDLISEILNNLEMWELFPGEYNLIIKSLLRYVCSEVNVLANFCQYFFHFAYETKQFDLETLQLLFQASPARCAAKVLIHYGQVVNSAEFKQFDYGKLKNIKKYGSPVPPKYYFENITAPTGYFYAQFDSAIREENVQQMISETKNAIPYRISHIPFNHLDFIFGKDMRKLVNEPAYHLLMKYVT